jgi:hypothetical protein
VSAPTNAVLSPRDDTVRVSIAGVIDTTAASINLLVYTTTFLPHHVYKRPLAAFPFGVASVARPADWIRASHSGDHRVRSWTRQSYRSVFGEFLTTFSAASFCLPLQSRRQSVDWSETTLRTAAHALRNRKALFGAFSHLARHSAFSSQVTVTYITHGAGQESSTVRGCGIPFWSCRPAWCAAA